MLKVLKVNAKTGALKFENLKEEYKICGGRGLIAQYMTDEVDPKIDPMGKDNPLIFTTGIFAGSNLPSCNRLSVGAKSPLTGTIKEANAGGTIAAAMAQHSIRMIVIEDMPDKDAGWKILKIDANGNPSIIDGSEYLGLSTYETCHKAFEQYSKDVAVLSIGVAGERQYLNSCIMVSEYNSGHSCRAAGRGGLGAVMGAKKIKAMFIEKPTAKFVFPYVDKAVWDVARKKSVDISLSHPTLLNNTKAGTSYLVGPTTALKYAPKNNFSGEALTAEEAAKYSVDVWMSKFANSGGKNSVPCQAGCVVRCSNHYNGPDGKHITSSLEYETVSLLGPNCGIYDFDDMARLDRMCDELGIDTIDAGSLVAESMEVGKIAWGDAKAALGLLEEMNKGTELGNQLGLGAARYGKLVGAKRIPAVKNQTLAAYEPRAEYGMGISYSVSTQGADHTFGSVFTPGEARDSKLKTAIDKQINSATIDHFNCIICTMAFLVTDQTVFPGLLKGAYGVDWTYEQSRNLGRKTLLLEREFNKRAGFTPEDDRLPNFFYNEPASTGAVFDYTDEELQRELNDLALVD